MVAVTVEEFESDCLALIDRGYARGETIVILKGDKSVAKLMPIAKERTVFGAMKGSVLYEGDIISPIDVEWNVLKDD